VLAFTGTALLVEFYRGVFARCRHRDENPLLALPRLVWADKPRYGGHIVHVGIVVMALGIAGSQLFATSVDATLSPGESIQVEDYNLTYDGLSSYTSGDKDVVAATLHVSRDGDSLGSMAAAKTFSSTRPDQPISNVAIRVRPEGDLFVTLNRWSEDGVTASFTVLLNPLMMWLWIGGSIVMVGAAVAFWPDAGAERRFAVTEVVPMPEMRPSRS
jgi:cytochrome c-type biogenesis protein CcmF